MRLKVVYYAATGILNFLSYNSHSNREIYHSVENNYCDYYYGCVSCMLDDKIKRLERENISIKDAHIYDEMACALAETTTMDSERRTACEDDFTWPFNMYIKKDGYADYNII